MPTWNWPGSRWWKCDFHVHSPGSHDYRDPNATAEDWVSAAHASGLHAIAVTDHNSGEWVDRLKAAANVLNLPLTVFPGVELTVATTIHLLVIYDPRLGSAAVAGILSRCGITNTMFGDPDATTTCSIHDAIEQALRTGDLGLPIPAHVDGPKGLVCGTTHANEEQKVIVRPDLVAVEFIDRDATKLPKVDNTQGGYKRESPLSRLVFSDAHALADIGRRHTWIKMTKPDIEGLRLAFIDGNGSAVLRDNETTGDPNTHAQNCIEEITVQGTKLIGRQAPFTLGFNPWFNALIGGRGSGKSTILEFIRLALQRGGELPERLREEFDKLVRVPSNRDDEGLLMDQAEIQVVYRKQDTRYRVTWKQQGRACTVEEQDAPTGQWNTIQGVVTQLFPVRIYSQKQIFQIAENPNALLNIIDQSPEVDKQSWDQQWSEKEQEFRRLRGELRELDVRLLEDVKLRGELTDVKRRIRVFQQQGHEAVLAEYQKRRGQQTALSSVIAQGDSFLARMEALKGQLPIQPNLALPAVFTAAEDEDGALAAALEEINNAVRQARSSVENAVVALKASMDGAKARVTGGSWKQLHATAEAAYNTLVANLQAAGAGSPQEYEDLLREEERITKRLQELSELRVEHQTIQDRMNAVYHNELKPLRVELSRKRMRFINSVLRGNQYVRIKLRPLHEVADAVASFRSLIKRDEQFVPDIFDPIGGTGVFQDLATSYPLGLGQGTLDVEAPVWRQAVEQVLSNLFQKTQILASLSAGNTTHPVRDQRFANCLQQVRTENQAFVDELLLIFPGDTLTVEYSAKGDGRGFVPLNQGSDGQKAAAILAFILSHGSEPLVLDQPEDDLDNKLISQLIVKQVQRNKSRRQLIIATHNANIVVNGDADMVYALENSNGQIRISVDEEGRQARGGLQEERVRQEICEVMEGGTTAFRRRYSRVGAGR